MNIFKKMLPILGALDPTGIINAVRPRDLAAQLSLPENMVAQVLRGLKETPEFKQAKMDHDEVMAQMKTRALTALDTSAEFSFLKGLLGSPRRFGVTIISATLAYLGTVAGTRAIFMETAVADVAGFEGILKMLGGTLSLLAIAYVGKSFSKNK